MQTAFRTKYKTHCLSTMALPDGQEIFILERPWLNNEPFISCIPAGQYTVHPDSKGQFKYYELASVPQRSFIEIHPANWVHQLEGCLAPCMDFNNNKIMGLRSREACELIKYWFGDSSWILNIVETN